MSRTYSIACTKCQVHLWIAQASQGQGHVYTAPHHARAHADFLFAHLGHPLIFADNCEGLPDDFKEIEVPSPPVLTADQRFRLTSALNAMKAVAATAGSMHSWWDVIFDAEAFMTGRPTIVRHTADEWVAECEQLLAEHAARPARRR